MFDFGSILGSGTVYAQRHRPGNEYIFEQKPGWLSLATLGLYVRPWMTIDYPDVPRSVGRLEAERFDPLTWKPEYPNPAFDNMRPDDAFWAARIVSKFSDEAIRAVVEKAAYSDPAATDFMTKTIIARRDKVVAAWINQVCPVVDPTLSADGTLTFANAAVDAKSRHAARAVRAQLVPLRQRHRSANTRRRSDDGDRADRPARLKACYRATSWASASPRCMRSSPDGRIRPRSSSAAGGPSGVRRAGRSSASNEERGSRDSAKSRRAPTQRGVLVNTCLRIFWTRRVGIGLSVEKRIVASTYLVLLRVWAVLFSNCSQTSIAVVRPSSIRHRRLCRDPSLDSLAAVPLSTAPSE